MNFFLLRKSRKGKIKKITFKLADLVLGEDLKEKRLNDDESRNRTKDLHLVHYLNFI